MAMQVAGLLETLGHPEEAEKLLDRVSKDAQHPEAILDLAIFLARQKRTQEALDKCAKARSRCRPEAVAKACIQVLDAAKATTDQVQQVEPWLEEIYRKEPSLVALWVYLAALRNLQGRYEESQTLYRQVLDKEPDNLTALNNLAWLLAEKDQKFPKALELVQRAVDAAGELPALLKTRGQVYLLMGKINLAIQDLQEVAATAPSGSVYFHLARAYKADKKDSDARAAFAKAMAAGFTAAELHPLERETYQLLVHELERHPD
jgi:tetratricopeptide (TPR) repeat protein